MSPEGSTGSPLTAKGLYVSDSGTRGAANGTIDLPERPCPDDGPRRRGDPRGPIRPDEADAPIAGVGEAVPVQGPWLRHIVLLRARPELPPSAHKVIEAAIAILVASPPHGSNGSMARDLGLRTGSERAATWMVTIDFASDGHFVDYLASREHTTFLREHGPNLEALLAIQIPV